MNLFDLTFPFSKPNQNLLVVFFGTQRVRLMGADGDIHYPISIRTQRVGAMESLTIRGVENEYSFIDPSRTNMV